MPPVCTTQSCPAGSYIAHAAHAGAGRNGDANESIPSVRPAPQSMGKTTPQALPSAAALFSQGGISRCPSEPCSAIGLLPKLISLIAALNALMPQKVAYMTHAQTFPKSVICIRLGCCCSHMSLRRPCMMHRAAACAQVTPQPSSEARRSAARRDLTLRLGGRKQRAEAPPAQPRRAGAAALPQAPFCRHN